MKARLAGTAALALMLGAWAYLAAWSYDEYDSLHATVNSAPVVLAVLVLTILGGFLVGRAWVLSALLGPIASLGYLESTGHTGPDGVSPLSSPPGISLIVWLGFVLGLGLAMAALRRHLRGRRAERDLRST